MTDHSLLQKRDVLTSNTPSKANSAPETLSSSKSVISTQEYDPQSSDLNRCTGIVAISDGVVFTRCVKIARTASVAERVTNSVIISNHSLQGCFVRLHTTPPSSKALRQNVSYCLHPTSVVAWSKGATVTVDKTADDGDIMVLSRYADGTVRLRNPHIELMDQDILYHLALGSESHDLIAMFGDVKFVCLGGTPKRMEQFAHFIMEELGHKLPTGTTLLDISQYSYRYSMYKVGPVLSISFDRRRVMALAERWGPGSLCSGPRDLGTWGSGPAGPGPLHSCDDAF
uniref:Uncharacterized protein n=1 Tax=Timema poppense TaxID=170557 RepID=A0A7R9CEW7_TIMPO|nr:unnamed protein product [Timema poppensis]